MPKDFRFKRKYVASWEREPKLKNWLSRSSDADIAKGNGEAYCKLCFCHLRAHHTDLIKHAETDKHVKKEKSLNRASQPTLESYGCVQVDDSTKEVDMKLAVFIALHCSIKSIDHLGELLKKLGQGSSLENIRIHRTKCSKIISNVIAPAYLTELLKDIGDSAYSIIADEATDVSVTKFMGLCVRYYSKTHKNMVTDFLGLVEVTTCTGKALADALKEYLKVIGLPISQMHAIGTDGAPNMCGSNNSFYTHLKEDVPDLELIKCICHSLDKCAEHSYKTIPDSVTFLVTETYNWFAHSAKRWDEYKQHYQKENGGKVPSRLQSLSKTRWMVWLPVASVILDQWKDLRSFFQLKAARNDFMAQQLQGLFSSKNLLYLTFLKMILNEVNKVNLAFEHTNADVTKLYSGVRNLVASVAKRVLRPEATKEPARPGVLCLDEVQMFKEAFSVASNLLPLDRVNLGDGFQQLLGAVSIPVQELRTVREKCGDFLLKLGRELCDRLPPNLSAINKIKYLSPKLALSTTVRPTFDQLPLEFKGRNVSRAILESQWNSLGAYSLPDLCCHPDQSKDLNKMDIVHFWSCVSECTDASGERPFEQLAAFALRALTLPVSNAVVERVFSLMNWFKNKRRNRMQLKLLEALLRLRVHLKVRNACCKEFEPTKEMLSLFNSRMYASFDEAVPVPAPSFQTMNADANEGGEVDANVDPDPDDANDQLDLEDEDYGEIITLFNELGESHTIRASLASL